MDDKSEKKYELLLAGIIAARATSFIFSKIILQYMAPFNLLALRFLVAFFLLAVLFRRQLKALTVKTLLSGMILGTLFFLTLTCELTALKQADSSLVSLLENCSIIFVPVFEAVILRRLPDKMAGISSAVAMSGVVLLAVQQGNLNGGFMFGLLAAVMYATAIVVTARFSRTSENSLCVGIIQVGMIGFLALAAADSLSSRICRRTVGSG